MDSDPSDVFICLSYTNPMTLVRYSKWEKKLFLHLISELQK